MCNFFGVNKKLRQKSPARFGRGSGICAHQLQVVSMADSIPKGFRTRRRDGKIVKRSSLPYHEYKLARRQLKRNKTYYMSAFEDKPYFEPSTIDAWTSVRVYQSTWLVQRLSGNNFIDDATAAKVIDNVTTVCQWIRTHKTQAARFAMASAGVWVAVLSLNYLVFPISNEWAFETPEFVERFSPSKLWDLFESAPASQQRDGVHVMSYEYVTKQTSECGDFERLLEAIRYGSDDSLDVSKIPTLLPNLTLLKPPKRIVHSQWGVQHL